MSLNWSKFIQKKTKKNLCIDSEAGHDPRPVLLVESEGVEGAVEVQGHRIAVDPGEVEDQAHELPPLQSTLEGGEEGEAVALQGLLTASKIFSTHQGYFFLRRSRKIRDEESVVLLLLVVVGGTNFQFPMYIFLGCEKAKLCLQRGVKRQNFVSKGV